MMNTINASGADSTEINQRLSQEDGEFFIEGCLGQRFLGAGMGGGKHIRISGIPGNALGAYLNGAEIETQGNAQDAVGDTMNAGRIIIHGNVGDTAGYAMRGGKIFIRGNAGYRTGVHMKEYQRHIPVIVIGGRAGSFLGEYQAGGLIIVLGLNEDEKPIVGGFPCTGMYGGKVFLRGDARHVSFPPQVTLRPAEQGDIDEISGHLNDYCRVFGLDSSWILASPFTVITPNSKNPYKQMYVTN